MGRTSSLPLFPAFHRFLLGSTTVLAWAALGALSVFAGTGKAPGAGGGAPAAQGEDVAGITARPAPPWERTHVTAPLPPAIERRISTQAPILFVPNRGQEPTGTLFSAQMAGIAVSLGKTGVTLLRLVPEPPSAADKRQTASSAGAGPSGPLAGKFWLHRQTIEFEGENPDVTVEPLERQTAKANFFVGGDHRRWAANVPTYGRVRYRNLWPGIDMIFYNHDGRLEYDFVVAAGADPGQIRLRIGGSDPFSVTDQGELKIGGGDATTLQRPLLYQNIGNAKKMVAGRFVKTAQDTVGFRFSAYDRSRTFIIDPAINLLYSTYVGGLHDDDAFGLTLDAAGNAYLVGLSPSQDFPTTGNAYAPVNETYAANSVVILKFDPSGALLYSTGLGGNTSQDYDTTSQGLAVVVDSSGDAWVGGLTNTTDFPVTQGAIQPANAGGQDGFLSEMSPDGSTLLYSTYIGGAGTDFVNSLVINADGSLWVAGGSSAAGLPASSNAFQPKPNGTDNYFVAKFVPASAAAAAQIPYLTYIGGSSSTQEVPISAGGGALAVDGSGDVYLAAMTFSGDYPVTANAYEKPFPLSNSCGASAVPNSVATLTKFSQDLSQMLYSTVIGGKTEAAGVGSQLPDCNQAATSIHLDSQGDIWLTGTTGESDFPVTAGAVSSQLDTNGSGGVDYFLFELSADGSQRLYGSYLGGSGYDYGDRAAWDASGNIWIVGDSNSANFPVTSNALQSANASAAAGSGNINNGYNVTLTELNPTATQILYSTYFGGSGNDCEDGNCQIAIDQAGNVHLAGGTTSTDFPLTPNAFQPVFADGDPEANGGDIFYTMLGTGIIGTIGPAAGGNTGDATITITGSGFEQGATCQLQLNGDTIDSTSAVVSNSGNTIVCTFNLAGAAAGSYNVTVADPNGGATFTKSGAYSITAGGGTNVWVNVVGRPEIRNGVPSLFTVNYGNSGDVDAYMVPLHVLLSPNLAATYTVGVPPSHQSQQEPQTATTTASGTLIPLVIPHLKAGASGSFQISIVDAVDNSQFSVSAAIGYPWYATFTDAQNELTAQSQNFTASNNCGALAPNATSDCLAAYLTQYSAAGATAQQVQDLAGGLLLELQQSQMEFAPTVSASVTGASSAPAQHVKDSSSSGSSQGQATGTLTVTGIPDSDDTIILTVGGPATPGVAPPAAEQFIFPVNSSDCVFAYGDINNAIGASFLQCTLPNVSAPVESNVTFAGISVEIDKIATSDPALIPKPDACFTVTQDIPGSGFTVNAKAGIWCSLETDVDPPDATEENPEPERPGPQPPDPVIDPDGGGSGANGSGASSIDPNAKSGSSGDGSSMQYVKGSTPLPYSIYFENEATASLPAAQVVVTDQLDPTKVDLSTLSLSGIAVGANTVVLPGGVQTYAATLNLNPTLNVRVQGGLDPNTGLLKWTFTSIDPSTGLPPTDPTVGFLPPDTDGVKGQGSVVFSVMPKGGQSTGAQINNSAVVVFDSNAPIDTATWTNTLDVDPPVSAVTALPATTAQSSFTVSWSGTDVGSGIASYNIYVSDNGGPFTLWQSAVATTSATYTGTIGHTYGFMSEATDKVGNAEAAKTAADASTQIVAAGSPDFSLAATTASLSIAPGASGAVTLNVTPVNGFNQPIAFACSGLPSEASCSFSPQTVTPNGSSATTTTVTITTTAATTGRNSLPWPFPGGGVVAACGLLFLGWRRRLRLPKMLTAVLLVGMLGLFMLGCGGGKSSSGGSGGTSNPGTPPGTSTVTVTASSGSLSHTTTVSLTVQ